MKRAHSSTKLLTIYTQVLTVEICLQSRTSLVGDQFLNSHDLNE